MSLESPNSSLLSDSYTIGTTLSGAACAVVAATTPSSRASAGTETRVSSATGALSADSSSSMMPLTPALGDEGLHLRLAGGALLRVPTSSSFCDRPGGAIRVAPTGLDFDVRPGGAICAAPAGLSHSVSRSGCFNATLAGIAPIP